VIKDLLLVIVEANASDIYIGFFMEDHKRNGVMASESMYLRVS